MLSTISNYSNAGNAYAAQSALTGVPKIPTALQNEERPAYKKIDDTILDTYRRADGTMATRDDEVKEVKATQTKSESVESDDDKQFKELLHKFVGQVLFGQMLKSMRATQEKNPYFHGGQAEEIFQSQLDMVLTDQMSSATSKSLSEPMYKLMKAPKPS